MSVSIVFIIRLKSSVREFVARGGGVIAPAMLDFFGVDKYASHTPGSGGWLLRRCSARGEEGGERGGAQALLALVSGSAGQYLPLTAQLGRSLRDVAAHIRMGADQQWGPQTGGCSWELLRGL